MQLREVCPPMFEDSVSTNSQTELSTWNPEDKKSFVGSEVPMEAGH